MLAQNGAWSILVGIPISCLKTMLPISEEAFICEERHSIDKSLFSEVSSSSSLGSPVDTCFSKCISWLYI